MSIWKRIVYVTLGAGITYMAYNAMATGVAAVVSGLLGIEPEN